MSAQAVQRLAERGDVKVVTDENVAPIQLDDGGSLAQDGGVGLVSHADAEVGYLLVGDEGLPIGYHVIRSPSVGNDELARTTASGNGVSLNGGEQLEEGLGKDDIVGGAARPRSTFGSDRGGRARGKGSSGLNQNRECGG